MWLSIDSITRFVTLFVLFLFPLTSLIYLISPIDLFDKNFYLIFCYFLILLIILINLNKTLVNDNILLFGYLLFLLLILITRTLFFAQTPSDIFENRIIFTLPLAYLFAISIRHVDKREILKIIIFIISSSAIVGIIHSIYFPEIFIGEGVERGEIQILDEGNYKREFSFFFSANLFGSMLVLGTYIILFHGSKIFNNVTRIFLIILFFIAVSYTQSRFPFLTMFLLIFLYVLRSKMNLLIKVTSLLLAFFVSAIIIGLLPDLILRFLTIDAGRILKASMAADLIFENIKSIIIGVSFDDVESKNTIYGISNVKTLVTISDNSILAVGMASGFFNMLIFILLLGKLIIKSRYKIEMVSIFLGFILYNTIYWDIYIFYLVIIIQMFSNQKIFLSDAK